ncbi:hypothetical protein ES692_17705 [Psychroserpens burtonensis]|uniref:Uncharacterized protein n=1 Tax=Psychroserpens burtonensis TaxID=49278 RepID=A0A5C7B533_9FLAO|nr:hypothetical protein [Psychroserpens burtonensis]TXE14899.1 hypothetical protein ES692_17705 [Psychroserpens burtonensis]
MTLRKETLSHYNQIEGYEKKYDPIGKLLFEHKYSPITGNDKTKFIYDQNEKVIQEITQKHDYSGNISILSKDYKYNENTTIISHSNVRSRNSFDDFGNKEKNWNETNEVFKIETFKYDDDLLLFKHTKNLKTGIEITDEYRYDSKKNQTDYIKNGTVIFNKEFNYENGHLISMKEYKYSEGRKFLAFSESYNYDNDGNITKLEKSGLYNSIMRVYNIIEYNKEENFSTEVYKGYYYYDEFLGYYNYESMLKENKDDFQLNYLLPTTFDDREFEICVFKKFDSRNDLIESYHFSMENEKKTHRNFFVHEYMGGKTIEFELCLTMDENDNLKKNYIKRYYY